MYSLQRRKYFDAAAGFSCGVSVTAIALGLRELSPSMVSLGWFAYMWAGILMLTSFGAGAGALLRTEGGDLKHQNRRYLAVTLERLSWPSLAGCAAIFGVAVAGNLGWPAALTTVGFVAFVVFTCMGNWWGLVRTLKHAEHDVKGDSGG